MTNTDELLRQEFEAWYDPLHLGDMNMKDAVTRAYVWSAYQACNAKRQGEMARDKALLRECAATMKENIESCCTYSLVMYNKLQQAGYGNELD